MIIRSLFFSHIVKIWLGIILVGFVITALTGCNSINEQTSNLGTTEPLTSQSDDDIEALEEKKKHLTKWLRKKVVAKID